MKKRTTEASISGLEKLIQNAGGHAVTILPDGTVMQAEEEEKQHADIAGLVTRRLDIGNNY